MKKTLQTTIIAASLLVTAQTMSAQITLLSDNFVVDSNQNDPNFEINRQTGTLAPSTYTTYGPSPNVQVGNSTTNVGQPGGASNSNYLLVALNGSGVYNHLPLSNALVNGNPLSFSFDLYTANSTDPTDWMSFQIGASTSGGPNTDTFGFLVRRNGGLQAFDHGTQMAPIGQDTPGFITTTPWTVTFSGAGGIGSPFNGTTVVSLYNSGNLLDQFTLSSGLNSTGDVFGFKAAATMIGGVDNLVVSTVPEPSAFGYVATAGLCLLVVQRRLRRRKQA